MVVALDPGESVMVSLMRDVANRPGSDPLDSFAFTGQTGGAGDPFLYMGTSVLRPVLAPNVNYWLVASAPDSTFAEWKLSGPLVSGLHAESINEGLWGLRTDNALGAFRINGTLAAVPIPGTFFWASSAWVRPGGFSAAGRRSRVSGTLHHRCSPDTRPCHCCLSSCRPSTVPT